GWSDAGLSLSGIEQAKHASERIAHGNYIIRHIFSSDLPRAKETADIIADRLGIGVTFLREFRETNNGDLAGISKERFQAEYPGLYYSSLDWEQQYPNGESPKLFYERITEAWRVFKNKADSLNGNVLLVTHGGVIDVILCIENEIPYTNRYAAHKTAYAEMISVQTNSDLSRKTTE
ncbi:MAG: histidine phosphatase family protein, partial [Ruminiclostridium sp.]|nr:histidine phosphatase family protein [Ruminiclostridium sp.]